MCKKPEKIIHQTNIHDSWRNMKLTIIVRDRHDSDSIPFSITPFSITLFAITLASFFLRHNNFIIPKDFLPKLASYLGIMRFHKGWIAIALDIQMFHLSKPRLCHQCGISVELLLLIDSKYKFSRMLQKKSHHQLKDWLIDWFAC